MRDIQGTQDQPVQNAEYHSVRAYGQRQRQNGDDCESRRFAQHPQAVARIVYQSLDEVAAERFVAFLLESPVGAELDARAAFRFGTIQAGPFQIVSAILDVRGSSSSISSSS